MDSPLFGGDPSLQINYTIKMNKLNFSKLKNINSYLSFPNMSATLSGWEVPLTLTKMIQSINGGFVSFTEQTFNFMGVWQPLKDEQLQFLPENQRSWEWIWIHAKASELNLQTADKVIFNNKRYKVMAVKDYSLNSFIEYQLVRDYEDNPINE